MEESKWVRKQHSGKARRSWKIMQCLCSGEQPKFLKQNEKAPQSSESLGAGDYPASVYSSKEDGVELQRPDTGNIEEAESSLREGLCLNYEEARALLGRLEYQRGNVDAALHVFEGIDIGAVIPNIKISIAQQCKIHKRRSRIDVTPPMSMHSVGLLMEAIFLKAKCLENLGKYKEAAESCKVILDTIESALPDGVPGNFGTDCKLQEILTKSVEMLPELWKEASCFHEAVLSYRRALLTNWMLDPETLARIQKAFAIFLLYSGHDARPPNLRSQSEGSFIPRNNIEEAILLLFILLRKFTLKIIMWDVSIIQHLTFALSITGDLKSLAQKLEELLPGNLDKSTRYELLALCYLGEGDDSVALSSLKRIHSSSESADRIQPLLLSSKICGEKKDSVEEGIALAQRALTNSQSVCDQLAGVSNCLLGNALSTQARFAMSDAERRSKQREALEALERAMKLTSGRDPKIIFHLCVEYAEQRKLGTALDYAKKLLKSNAGSSIQEWLLLARILSGQKRYADADTIVNAALDETGKWDQGKLLQLKAKLLIAQGDFKNAVSTYTRLLAVLHVKNKLAVAPKWAHKGLGRERSLEMEAWHELARVYISMSQWQDAEVCLTKSAAISSFSASRWHVTGLLYEAKGQPGDALRAYLNALEIEPGHVESLISAACNLKNQGRWSLPIARGFLTEALRLDRMNHAAWFNLGLVHKEDGSVLEACECFQAAVLLEETAPVESFRC